MTDIVNPLLLQETEQVTHMCRSQPAELSDPSPDSTPGLSPSQKLRKVLVELVDTEKAYVKDLEALVSRYLEPLRDESLLCTETLADLHASIADIISFQRRFLAALQDAVDMEPGFLLLQSQNQFRHVLFSVAGSFCFYANQFKVYSSFCATHARAQKLLHSDECSPELAEFLRARNPKQQHSATLESFLIKPIQRVLKYPLLLRELRALTPQQSDEHKHLTDAIQGMEAVAEHINEMQKIHEEYGAVFSKLQAQAVEQTDPRSRVDLSVSELQLLGPVQWLGGDEEVSRRARKGAVLAAYCFVFRSAVVLLVRERKQSRRKSKISGAPRPQSIVNSVEPPPLLQTAIAVSEVQVRSGSSSVPGAHVWELVHCPHKGRAEKIYSLSSSLPETRNAFLRCINQMIREHVRQLAPPSDSAFNHVKAQKTMSLSRATGTRATNTARHSAYVDVCGTDRHRRRELQSVASGPETDSPSTAEGSAASVSISSSSPDRPAHDRSLGGRGRTAQPSVLPGTATCLWNPQLADACRSEGPSDSRALADAVSSPIWKARPLQSLQSQVSEVETYDNVPHSSVLFHSAGYRPNAIPFNHPNVLIEYEDDFTEC